MNIVVIGTGYVGLVAGTCFAETGNSVYCVDIDENKISRLKSGDPVIFEPGLETLLKKNIASERLCFTSDLSSVAAKADIIFTAVGTPTGEDGSADLSYLLKAVEDLAPLLEGYTLIVNKSTVPVGTIAKIKEILKNKVNRGVTFDVASNPEFLKEGVAVQDFLYPDRVVLGVENHKAAKMLHELYEPFVRSGNPIITMDIKSAELTKYASNCFLATKISFINDIAVLCEKVGADVNNVRAGMSTDSRIGKSFLYAGVGYGGSCFPKDVKALINTAEEFGVELPIIRSAEKVNYLQKRRFIQKILDYFKGDIKGKVFAVWGLSFKPQTDDIREAPSVTIINELCSKGAKIKAHDPIAIENAKKTIGTGVEYYNNQVEVLHGADALLLITEWNEYRGHNTALLKEHFNGKVIFDGRNIYDPDELKEAGFDYFGIGRA